MTPERLAQLQDFARGATACCEDNAAELVELVEEVIRLRAVFAPSPVGGPQIASEIEEAREYLDLDPDEPETWERDLLRAVAATQRALVHVRASRLSCPTCRGSGQVSDPNLFGAYLRCPACRP